MSPSVLRAQVAATLSSKFEVSFRMREKATAAVLHSGISDIDLPRGTLSEIYGPSSSGRTGCLLGAFARATRLPESCALIDASDSFDPRSGADAGVDLSQLLWIRCGKNAEHALKAADLLVQAGGFGLIALDLAGIPTRDARRISLTSWFRLRHTVEKTSTALVVLGEELIARSCSTLHIELRRTEIKMTGTLLRGVGVEAELGPRLHRKSVSVLQPVFRS
jgi:recombination protein RecA